MLDPNLLPTVRLIVVGAVIAVPLTVFCIFSAQAWIAGRGQRRLRENSRILRGQRRYLP